MKTIVRRPGADVDDVDRPPGDVHPALVLAPVDVQPRRAARAARTATARGRREAVREPSSIIGVPQPMRIAIDIDSTLHHYWDVLSDAARRRFGIDLPYEEQFDLGHHAAEARAARSVCIDETHSDAAILAGRPYPGAVETVNAWHEAGPLHPHHQPPRTSARTRPPSAGCDEIGLPLRRALLLLRQGRPLPRDRHRRAHRRHPVNLAARPRRGHRRRRRSPPVEPRRLRGGGRARCADDWPGLARALEPVPERDRRRAARTAMTAEPRRRPRSTPAGRRDLLPAIEPERQARRLGPLGAHRGRSSTARSTSSSTASGSAARSRAIENVPSDGGALLVSNHAGALPPDARDDRQGDQGGAPAPAAGAPHRRALLQGLSRLLHARCRRSARVPAHPANVHRLLYDEGQLVLVFPEGRKGTEKLYKDRYRLRRFGRGGFVEAAMRAARADRADRRRRRRGGAPIFAHVGAAAAAHGPALLPDHADVPALRACSAMAGYLPAKFNIRFLRAGAHRRHGRRAVGGQGPRAGGRPRDPRARSRRSSSTCSAGAARVWFG